MRKLADTKKMTHEEWLELRKSSIGGSEAGIIMGSNPYASLLSLYLDKKGLSSPKETNEAMRLGNDLEAYVAERYMEKTGNKVRNDNFMYQHDDYDFITANIDRRIVGENAGLECKTMSSFNGYKLDEGEVPAWYYAQTQHYMMVMGFDYMDLAILVYQNGVYTFHIERNEEYIQELLAKEIDFWKTYIEADQVPEPDGSEASKEAIKELYPYSAEISVDIPGIDELLGEYQFLQGQIKDFEKEKEEIQNKITYAMGDAERCDGIRYSCTWKSQNRTTINNKLLKIEYPEVAEKCSETKSSRVFRVKKLKGEE